ncbi:MAG: cell division protein ZapA [Pseudomonadota bacterium]
MPKSEKQVLWSIPKAAASIPAPFQGIPILDWSCSAAIMHEPNRRDIDKDTPPVRRSLSVDIAGQRFTVRTDADESYVRSLAEFVTDKLEEARKGSKTVATQSLAILAALNIADDLFQTKRMEKELRRRVREKSHAILELLEKEAGAT